MIRLAVRCAPQQAEVVLAELTVLAPNGVEEEAGPGYVEYAIYGGEGELPELGELEAAAGDGLVEVVATEVPDDWADRWQDFHRPIVVGERLWVGPSWAAEEAGGLLPVVVDPGRAFGTGAHATTRLCLELLLGLAGETDLRGPLTDLGTGSGVLAIAAAKLGWGPVCGCDHEPASIEAAAANAKANAVDASFSQVDFRDDLPPLAPTVLANMTAPVLRLVAAGLATAGPPPLSPTRESPPPSAGPPDPFHGPVHMLCSGLLPAELDEVAGWFAAAGLEEVDRRIDGDWAALRLGASFRS